MVKVLVLSCSTVRLLHIMLNKRPIMPFSNAAKYSLLCHSVMLLNVAYYAFDPPLLFYAILSINIKIMIIHFIQHYNNNNIFVTFVVLDHEGRFTI